MPLQTHWRNLDRQAARGAPDRPGVIEYGDERGTVVGVEAGVIRDSVKSALAYGDGAQVRWETTHTVERAEELAATHRERLE